jgi:hypothetical protein
MILPFPRERAPLFAMAENYVKLYVDKGVDKAGAYLNSANCPPQLKYQLKDLIQEEFKKRGMNIEVK